MKIFVAASYSSQVNYNTGEVLADYRTRLEETLATLEAAGHSVFCALREDQYKINSADSAAAFRLDKQQIEEADCLLALLTDKPSAGVQTEIGVAVALNKRVLLAHLPEHSLSYFNSAMVRAGVAEELALPLDNETVSTLHN